MKAKSKTDFRVIRGFESEKFSMAHCRKVLGEEANEVSDEEVLEIRDFFYRLAAIAMEQYHIEKSNETLVINLEHNKATQDEKESSYLRAS